MVLAAKKSFIKFVNKFWIRKDRPACFDITMGRRNSPQVADVVKFYILYEMVYKFLHVIFICLYRNNCLLYIQNVSNKTLQEVKISVVKFFKNMKFDIVFDDDVTKGYFLNITVDVQL